MKSCYVFFLFFFVNRSTATSDTIRQGEQLGYYDNLILSKNGGFSLRFFTFDTNEKRQYYLGLFTDLLQYDPHSRVTREEYGKRALWVANRNNPITNVDPKLTIDEYGNLKISNYDGTDPFVLNSFEGAMLKKTHGERKINASATLLNNGNFVLREMNLDGSY